MNALFNNNFLLGFLLAKELPRQEQLQVGLLAAQMPANSPISLILLKPLIDRRLEAERARAAAQAELDTVHTKDAELGLSTGATSTSREERLSALVAELQAVAAARPAGSAPSGTVVQEKPMTMTTTEEADYTQSAARRAEKAAGPKVSPTAQTQPR